MVNSILLPKGVYDTMKLKFRRWDKINKVMLQHKDIPVLLKNAQNDNQFEYMPWTGLLDKAGVEIFEGDLYTYCIGGDKQVTPFLVEDLRSFYEALDTIDSYLRIDLASIEVIGNKWDNGD